jgi:hypothetical protein
MLIGSPQMIRNVSNFQPNIIIENKQIRQVNKTKTLGTTIDQSSDTPTLEIKGMPPMTSRCSESK